MRTTYLLALASLMGAVALAQASPPETFYLTPAKYKVSLNGTVRLQYTTGRAAAAAAPWPDDVGWLFTRAATTQENRHDVRPERAQDNFVRLPIGEAGVTLIGADCDPAAAALTGAEFREFVKANVAAAAVAQLGDLPAADVKARVQVVRSAKTLVRAANAAGEQVGSAIAASKAGQAVEIQPLTDPTVARVGDDLPLRVFIGGDKKSAAKVQAAGPSGKVVTLSTDPVGACHLRITEAGEWRIQFHHAMRLEDHAAADWVIYSATLTFEVPAEGGAR